MKDEEYLDMIPVQECEHETNDGIVTVHYIKKPTVIEKIFFRKQINQPYKIDLDEIGSFIWGQINGVLNIREIIDITKEHFGEKVEPVEERVLKFIKQMHNTKLILLYQRVIKDIDSNK